MEKWIRDRLSLCLDFPIPDDMITYIMSIKSSEAFDEYFESLLNIDCDEHRSFLFDCKQRLFSKQLPNKNNNNNNNNNKAAKAGNASNAAIKQNHSQNAKTNTTVTTPPHPQGAKKKTKFVKLYSNDGRLNCDSVLLKGRKVCECQASEHKLINNCLGCGRIVCEQEGSGPCLFCGEIVCTNEERQLLKNNSKTSQNLMQSLKEKGGGKSLQQAMEQRDRLLEYDRNSEKRTTVIDDELDYFQENSVWLSEAERERFAQLKQEMHEKKHASRAKRVVKVDFAGREIDESVITESYEKEVLNEIAETKRVNDDKTNWSNSKYSHKITTETCETDPNLQGMRPIYKATAEGDAKSKDLKVNDGLERIYNRVQDKELLEMQDMRQCLSMHQPWASLLVAGIKKHEGRVWYTEHRGRLWIASTSKEPKQEEIEELENFYRHYYNDPSIEFPKEYPAGCLLGCVNVDDCQPQEEYREVYPEGESESPYVFICTNPQKLPYVFPIKGQPKIYQIELNVHNAACKTLMRLQTSKG